MNRQAQGLGAVVAGEIGLELPGGEQHLGDATQFSGVVASVDGPGPGFKAELAGKREAVQGRQQALVAKLYGDGAAQRG